ncbi:hypothetical protein ACQKP7_18260 [Pseudomonas frederiksbergensis]|uniref:hypothetical protein n=1 Tax=Pseudomonas frederiksbergensis TaxID=104087 RepID=UPI003D009AF9
MTLGEGTHTIIAVAMGVDGQEFPSAPVTFSVRLALPAPQITQPEAGSVQDMNLWIGGTGADYSAQVQLLEDFNHDDYGYSLVTLTGGWGRLFNLAPGVHSIVARQTINGRQGPVGIAHFFKVRPSRLTTVNVEILPSQEVKFSGTGHNGATVVLTYVSGPNNKPLPEVVVANGVWQISAPDWENGIYTYSAIQKVSDNAGGWIPSQDFQFSFPVSTKVPDPTNVRASADYSPIFSGNGVTGATVLIRKQDGTEAAPPAVVVNSFWSSQSRQEWGPTFDQIVQVKQRLDGQESEPGVGVVVRIAPLPPVISSLSDNELSPLIAGTCWSGAVVNLVFSDNPAVHTAAISGTEWQFRRRTEFAPGVPHTVSVTQTAAQQTSAPATRTFEIRRTLLKPVIIDPANGGEAERDLRVRGDRSVAGARMQLRVDGIDTGPATLTNGGLWYIELKGLAFGRRILDAQQTLDGRPSERSDPVVVNVVLMPPQFTTPQPGGDLPRTSTISGTGMPGARVDVWLEGRDDFLLRGYPVDSNGRWSSLVILPVGVKTLQARQAIEQVVSRDSPPLTFNVVPAAPYIETPVKDGHIGGSAVVSGFGVPGDTVSIYLGDTLLGGAPVLEDRTWSVPVTLTQPDGAHVLVAVASLDGFKSDRSAQQPVVLGRYEPSIDSPRAGSWVSHPVTFSGQGRLGTGQLVSWFNPELPWAPNLAVSAQGWHGLSVRALPAGGNWCRFQQTIVDGADASTISDWSESARFEVLDPASR